MTERGRVLEIGEPFGGRYRIERLLGSGGMGAVYAAFDEVLRERVALKVLSRAADRAVARFQREVRLSRKVTSPHVARTFDIGSHDGTHYLTMELIDGESLEQRLRRQGTFTVAETVRIGRELAAGLASAHEASVLHRDLKPANVMIERGGRVVITDFGVARSLEPMDDGLHTRGLLGTPRYMAPEVISGGTADERTDLHALGLVLHEMRTGKPTSVLAALHGEPAPVLDGDAGPVTQVVAEPGTAQLDALIAVLVSVSPSDRPSSAADVLARLVSIEAEPESGVTSTLIAPTSQPARRLAVLPFAGRGTEDAKELAAVLAEELVDVLSRNQGLQVLAHASSAHLAADDVMTAGRQVGADWVVNGTVTARGPEMRVTVRLIASSDGAQLYTERFDVEITDLFELQDRIAQRIGEALRVEVTLVARRGDADADAIGHYLRARRCMSTPHVAPGNALSDLDAAIARAPGFAVAIAAHAVESAKNWFVSSLYEPGAEQNAERSVERALAEAGDLAETHLAAGIWAAHAGDYRRAADALRRALEIAPTYAQAQEYLGRLECEAGHGARGARRLALAMTLDPKSYVGQYDVARWHALEGRFAEATDVLDRVEARVGPPGTNGLQIRMRIAAWSGDLPTVARCRDAFGTEPKQLEFLRGYGALVLGEVRASAYAPTVRQYAEGYANRRFSTLTCQLAAEALSIAGSTADAVHFASRAADHALADIDWLARCPVLDAVRTDPSYPDIQRRVRERAAAIWHT